MKRKNKTILLVSFIKIFLAFNVYLVTFPANAFTLWSQADTFMGTGKMYGPGSYDADQELFSMVLKNLAFTDSKQFVMPFYNNGALEPNTCSETEMSDTFDGKLSNSQLINENADMCSMTIAGTDMLVAVISNGPLNGQQHYTRLDNGDIEVKMDLALDLNIGEKGVIKLAFFGTTGSLKVPLSLQTQNNNEGIDYAGKYKSGTQLSGRIGDFNNDGWIDGTLVAVGNIPLDSPVFPGQPYAMHRHFELNIPVEGFAFGNVKALVNNKN